MSYLTEAEIGRRIVQAEKQPGEQLQLIRALRPVVTTASIPVLRAILTSSDLRVRTATLRTLARVGGSEAVDAISSVLSQGDDVTVGWAAQCLATMNAQQAAPALINCAAARVHSLREPGRTAVVRALGVLKDRRAAPVLQLYVSDDSASVRRAAAIGLRDIGTPESRSALASGLAEMSWLKGRFARRALRLAPGSNRK